jgi:O-antigen/teichoic acid export membrane protein
MVRSEDSTTGTRPAGAEGADGEPEGTSPPPGGSATPGPTDLVFGNILSLASGTIVSRIIAFIGTAYLARQLGPEGFGIVGFALAVCGYLAIAVSGGFDDVGAREVARRREDAGRIAAGVTALRLGLAVMALLATAGVALLLPKPPLVKLVVVLTGLSYFSLALNTSWVYKGLEQLRRVGIMLVIGQLLFVATVLLLVRGPEDVVTVPLAQFFGELTAALLLIVPLLLRYRPRIDLREGVRILRSSLFWAFSRLLRTLIGTFDVVLIGVLIGEWEVGIYAAVYRVCFLVLALSGTTHQAYLPVFARVAHAERKQFDDAFSRSAEMAAAVALPILIGGIVLAGPLLGLLFGEEYVVGATAFQLLLVSVGLSFLYGTIHNVLLVQERTRDEARIIFVAAAANIGANVVLIPMMGIVGAAISAVLAHAITALAGGVVLLRLGLRPDLRPMLRPALAAAVMGLVLLLADAGRAPLIAVAAGGFLYCMCLVIVGGIPRDMRPHADRWVAAARRGLGS